MQEQDYLATSKLLIPINELRKYAWDKNKAQAKKVFKQAY
jgi:hypothetical protein